MNHELSPKSQKLRIATKSQRPKEHKALVANGINLVQL